MKHLGTVLRAWILRIFVKAGREYDDFPVIPARGRQKQGIPRARGLARLAGTVGSMFKGDPDVAYGVLPRKAPGVFFCVNLTQTGVT